MGLEDRTGNKDSKMQRLFSLTIAALIGAGTFTLTAPSANADSCWNHNGSLMRLKASGDQRWMYYEAPREVLRRAGVKRGTLLFDGWKRGNSYTGSARRFSRYCPGNPLVYEVSGPVSSSQTKITVSGQREVHKRCRGTGRYKRDRLVFTYSHQC